MLPLVASITVWPGCSVPRPLGVLDDAERKPVLDRAHRVEGLDLDVQIDVRRRELVDPHDRRVADRAEDVVELAPMVEPSAAQRRAGFFTALTFPS